MSLQQDVLETLRTRGAMSNAEIREAMQLDNTECARVSGALKDLARGGHVKVIPPDAVTRQRYEAVQPPPRANAVVRGAETPRSLRSAAIRLLMDAGEYTMPCAKHEKLLSLIARAEALSTPAPTLNALTKAGVQ